MDAVTNDYVPWRERAFVSVSETAAIFARSTTWVRNRVTDRSLETAGPDASGPLAITVRSVLALIERSARRQDEPLAPRKPRRSGTHLRLVIDNSHS